MKTAFTLLAVSVAALMGADASLLPCSDKRLEDTPFSFLVRMCETAEETKNFTELLLTELLDEKKAPNTHPILEEYAIHFKKLEAGFCKEFKANNEPSWKGALKSEYPHADDIYDVLMCRSDFLKSFIDSNPPELQKVQKSSLDDLKWLIDNAERLHLASEKDFRNIE